MRVVKDQEVSLFYKLLVWGEGKNYTSVNDFELLFQYIPSFTRNGFL